MKKLIIVAAVLVAFVLSGCILTDWLTPEPVVPVMEAVVAAELVLVVDEEEVVADYWTVEWSITNIGEENIFNYTITFRVYYPVKDYTEVVVESSAALEVGAFYEGVLELEPYGEVEPWSVSATWELFN